MAGEVAGDGKYGEAHRDAARQICNPKADGATVKILVDALFLRPGENGGGESYIRGLLAGLSRLDRENSYLVLVTRDSKETFRSLGANFEAYAIKLGKAKGVLRLAYEQVVLPILARRWGADLAFFPANMMSLVVTALSIPSVVTIHDASFDYYQRALPSYEPSLELNLKASLAKWAAHAATQIVAVSEFGRSEIVRTTGVSTNKIAVVHLAPSELSGSLKEPEEVFRRYGIATPYVLAVGTVQKHKNFERLVRAFAAAKRNLNCPHELVIAGRRGTGQADLETAIRASGASDYVCLTGFTKDGELATLYKEADAFVMPSLYEGFGIPVLEAMKAGIPVISSAVCSLPEVAGDAALFCDPLDEHSISKALCEVISNRDHAMDLARKGNVRAGTFSWERTAARMLEIFESVAQRKASVTATSVPAGSLSCTKVVEPTLRVSSRNETNN
jgi:glycosyltransferase involved in cell wall biosynthesis